MLNLSARMSKLWTRSCFFCLPARQSWLIAVPRLPHPHRTANTLSLTRSFAAQAVQKALDPEPLKACLEKGDRKLPNATHVARKVEAALQQADSINQEVGQALTEEEQADAIDESWQDIAAKNARVQDAEGGNSDLTLRRISRATKLYEDDDHNIRGVHIPRSAWLVLIKLRSAGHECYLVGGAVRDMLLRGMPKDFDILTSATVQQVKRLLHRSRLVGKRFPIVQVSMLGSQLEVSSFSTGVSLCDLPFDAAALLGNKNAKLGNQTSTQGQGRLWKAARKQNALARDFTVNALMYDPFSRVIFDYTDGVADCRKKVLRTIVDPEASFEQDPARILRAVRLAARAGLKIEEATARAITKCRRLILDLPNGRLTMEVQSLLGYGAAQETIRLLWRLNLLDLLFPVLSGYLGRKKYPKRSRTPRNEVLFTMLQQMDMRASFEKPIPPPVWMAILAAPVIRHEVQTRGIVMIPPSPREDTEPISLEHVPEMQSPQECFESNDLPQSRDVLEEEPSPSDIDMEGEPNQYLEVVQHIVTSYMEGSKVPLFPRVAKPQIVRFFAAEQLSRQGDKQETIVKCKACHQEGSIPVFTKKMVRCSNCQAALPRKAVRKFRSPELRLVLDVLHNN